jgi:hypothetical protein
VPRPVRLDGYGWRVLSRPAALAQGR